jgi:hypothetical protein
LRGGEARAACRKSRGRERAQCMSSIHVAPLLE